MTITDPRIAAGRLRALALALALAAPLAACDFGGDAANCIYGEAIEDCAGRLLPEGATVAQADAFFLRRGFDKAPRVTRTGAGDAHVYARDEARGARTLFMVATFAEEDGLRSLEKTTRRN